MKIGKIIDIALKGIALAIGIAVEVLSVLDKVEMKSAISMLGIGLACLAITQFSEPHSIGDKTAVVTKISAEWEK